MLMQPVLQEGDGAVLDWPTKCWKDFFSQRHRIWSLSRRHDPDCGLQHEEGHQGSSHHQVVGPWGSGNRPNTSLYASPLHGCGGAVRLNGQPALSVSARQRDNPKKTCSWAGSYAEVFLLSFSDEWVVCSLASGACGSGTAEGCRPSCMWWMRQTTTTWDSARLELAELLGKPSLQGIPLLVLGNKNDLPGALSTTDLIDRLDLKVNPY